MSYICGLIANIPSDLAPSVHYDLQVTNEKAIFFTLQLEHWNLHDASRYSNISIVL